MVGVSDSSHCGAMGLYTRTAAKAKLLGIAMTHSSSVVAPHGGKDKFFGTNPLSIAFPRARGEPIWELLARYLRAKKSIAPIRAGAPRLVGVEGNPGLA